MDETFKGRTDNLVEKHFKETGYFENRKFPALVDVEYYKKKYPDLAAAASKGEISDLKAHFFDVGLFEKRAPSAGAEEEMKSWAQIAKAHGHRRSTAKSKR